MDSKWLANMDGFGMPTDVYSGTILLVTIESQPDAYVISIDELPFPKGKGFLSELG